MNWPAWIIGGALALVWWGDSVGRYRIRQRPPAEWLARMITLEAGDIGPGDEWSAIMQVAINRLQSGSYGPRMENVICRSSWPGGGARGRDWIEAVQAEGGRGYTSAYGKRAPPDHPRWSAAMDWAARVWSGQVPNRIGSRLHFYHPGGMLACGASQEGQTSPRGTLICIAGRWRPLWGVPRSQGGTARQEPIQVGRAIFS